MEQWITEVAFSIVSALGTIIGSAVLYYITKTIKNEKIKNILLQATNIIGDGVDYVYQTFVENIKGTTLWDQEAMNKAKNMAVDYVNNHLSKELITFLTANKGDLTAWIEEQIEIAIKKSKDKNKEKTA